MGAEAQEFVALSGTAGRVPLRRSRSETQQLVRRVSQRCAVALLAANAMGAAILFGLGLYVIPAPQVTGAPHLHALNVLLFAILLPASLVVGLVWSFRSSRRALGWAREDRPPTPEEARATLRYPLRQAVIEATLWTAAALAFTALNAPYSWGLGLECGIEIVLGGLTTCAITYLIGEKVSQPINARVLELAPPDQPSAPGVECRMMLAWVFGSAVPLLGLGLLGVAMLYHVPPTHVSAGLAVLLLASVGVIAGLVTIRITSKMVAGPLDSLRGALARVERGELHAELPVDDASEVGQVQAAFNSMVRGLRERDRLRDLFGRHVGEEVARNALERHDIELGGETRDAAVLFVDLVGSTSLASSSEPAEVVRRLNAFFAIVVDCVSLHGGWVNKFEGDAALCVFGAPATHPDPAGSALATARALAKRLREELPGLQAGIGVSAGSVVAGNVGAAERFEYTVIGDPVNEAARLTELAKAEPGKVLASEAALTRASRRERERWSTGRSVPLRGRREPTTVASPCEGRLAVAAAG